VILVFDAEQVPSIQSVSSIIHPFSVLFFSLQSKNNLQMSPCLSLLTKQTLGEQEEVRMEEEKEGNETEQTNWKSIASKIRCRSPASLSISRQKHTSLERCRANAN